MTEGTITGKRWPFAFNFLLFSAFAFVGPYFVLYYQELGYGGAQIGLLTGLTPLITFFGSPLWTALADSTERHRLVLGVAVFGGILTLAAFPMLSIFWVVLFNACIFNLFFAPVAPLIDSATIHMLGAHKQQYGRIRLGGTIGFALAAIFAGSLIERFGLRIAFWGAGAILLVSTLLIPRLAFSKANGESKQTIKNIRLLLQRRTWVLFLALGLAAGLGIAGTLSFFPPYMAELGMPESSMGLALSLGTLAEIPILFYGDKLLRRFPAGVLFLLGIFAFGLRFLLLGLNSSPVLVFFLQALLGMGFPALWIAGVAYADENAPAGLKSSAQGLFVAMIFGIGPAIGGLIGGPLLEGIGGRGLHLAFGITILMTSLIIFLLDRAGNRPFSAPNLRKS